MTSDDDTFEAIARSLRSLTGGAFEELLARATDVARNAICITDADLDPPGPRIVYVNPAFEQMTGYTSTEALGRNPRFLQGPLSDREVLRRLRADLQAGRSFQGETYNYRKDGTPFRLAWRVAALRGAEGEITHYVAAQDDVTAVRQAEHLLREHTHHLQQDAEWLSTLVDLGVSLARTAGPDDVFDQVVTAARDALGASTAIIVLDDEERHGWLVASSGGPDAPAAGSRYDRSDGSLVGSALRHRQPQLESANVTVVGAGIGRLDGAVAVLPIDVTPGQHPDGVVILHWGQPRLFRPAERTHLSLLARLTAMTHRKAQELENQASLAAELQGALLPSLGELPGLETAWRYRSVADDSVVGGDWYDAVVLPSGAVALFVGDVVGHGAPAAALMGEVRFTTRGLLRAFDEPGAILDELDAALLAAHAPGTALVTSCAVMVWPDGALRYSAAGHPHPVVRRVDGHIDVLDGARSRLLGAGGPGHPRPTAVDHLHRGDTLVAFSDGVFETRGQDYDDAYRTLVARLAAATDTPDGLCDGAVGLDHADFDPHAFRDDVVVLAVRRWSAVAPGAVGVGDRTSGAGGGG